MQGSKVASRAVQATFHKGRPREAVGTGADADRSGAVLALVVRDLARPWRKQRRTVVAGTSPAQMRRLAD
jgi:hypothetical protein